MSTFIIIILVTIVFSAFFSGMEIAFISANKLRFEIDKKQKKFPSALVDIFVKNPAFYITTMLVGNNIALVIYGIFMAIMLEPVFERFISSGVLIFACQTLISTIIILILAEFIPKAVFRLKPNNFLNIFAIPVLLIYLILFPVTWSITHLSNYLLKKFFKFENKPNDIRVYNKIDLTNLISEETQPSNENSEINRELKIFKNALDFSKVKLRDCMIPRPEILAVEVNSQVPELKQKFIETRFSKILVFKETIDNIIGYVSSREFFNDLHKIEDGLIKLPFYPETMPANKLLKEFIKEKKNIAVVVDEFGGTSGIVTIEDVIEEIFGEIEDEHDEADLIDKKLNSTSYIFSGRLEIDFVNEKYKLNIPVSDEYETIAGYILFHNESIPKSNDEILIENFKIKVLKVSKTKLELVKFDVI